MKIATTVLGVAIVGMVGLIANAAMHPSASSSAPMGALEASIMPAGVTLQMSGDGGPMGNTKFPMVLADPKGLSLYYYDKDTVPGKSACNDDCAKAWVPLIAPATATASGDWTVATRDDGQKQWAFAGHPLYTSTLDTKPNQIKGNGTDGVWHAAIHTPGEGVSMPDGITAREMTNAGGIAFVDARKKTLYAFAGDVKQDMPPCPAGQTCMNHWFPLTAPELANSVGDFTTVSRSDGTKQWAFKGRALYTYDADIATGEANGRDVDPKYQVALLERYYMPTDAAVVRNVHGYDMLATKDGKTLYARDRYIFQVGGFSLKGGQKGFQVLGRALGALTCPSPDCTKTYPPFTAPADAKPSGYWTVVTRPDGSKQWAYGGYALYTFTGDTKPGDATAHDSFDISIKLPPTPSPIDAVSGLYWREVMP